MATRTKPSSPVRAKKLHRVVVGPTGVFTIETKSYGGRVEIRRRLLGVTVRGNGRDLSGVVATTPSRTGFPGAHVRRAVRRRSRHPVVVVHRGELTVGWFAAPVVDGVRWCTGRSLRVCSGEGRRRCRLTQCAGSPRCSTSTSRLR